MQEVWGGGDLCVVPLAQLSPGDCLNGSPSHHYLQNDTCDKPPMRVCHYVPLVFIVMSEECQGQAQRKKSNLVENPKYPQCPSPKVPVQTLVP